MFLVLMNAAGLDASGREQFDERDVKRVRSDVSFIANFIAVHTTNDEVLCVWELIGRVFFFFQVGIENKAMKIVDES